MRHVVCCLLFATAAMAQPQTVALQLNEAHELTWDGGQSLSLNWEEVVADSRCPSDAVCVWAGEVELRLTVTASGADATSVNLRLPEREDVSAQAVAAGYSIRLEQVDPEASLTSPPTAATYRAHLTVAPPGTLLPDIRTVVTRQGWAHLKLQASTDQR